MNPVRAGIVKDPSDFYCSSYGARVRLRKLDWLDFDPMYISLGETEDKRQNGYRRWFHENISSDEWRHMREAVQRNWAYGNDRFKEEMETIWRLFWGGDLNSNRLGGNQI